jgi:hypothetical protein
VLVDYQSLTILGFIGSLHIYEPPKVQEMRRQPMNEQQSLSHTVWNCKYHIVWIPTYRKKSRFKELRQYVGRVLKDLAKRKECKIEEGHLLQIMFIF